MNLLLDTHVLIWWDEGASLPNAVKKAIHQAPEVFVSSASAWEIAIKTVLGRLAPRRTVREAVAESGFAELPVTFRHTERLLTLPPHHRDPFDRLLIAQALEERLTLVTRDTAFRRYKVPLLRA